MDEILKWLLDQGSIVASAAIGVGASYMFTSKIYNERINSLEKIYGDRMNSMQENIKYLQEELENSDKKCEARIEGLEKRYHREIKALEERSEKSLDAIRSIMDSSERRVMATLKVISDIKTEIKSLDEDSK